MMFQGDSGGPLVVAAPGDLKCMWDLIGVTSFGSRFCADSKPSVYARVYKYIPWLERQIWGSGLD